MPQNTRRQRAVPLAHVNNDDRRFGADPEYWGRKIIWKGKVQRALFTEEDIEKAVKRGNENPEDTRKF